VGSDLPQLFGENRHRPSVEGCAVELHTAGDGVIHGQPKLRRLSSWQAKDVLTVVFLTMRGAIS
jgi:hypothetical protein